MSSSAAFSPVSIPGATFSPRGIRSAMGRLAAGFVAEAKQRVAGVARGAGGTS